MAELTVLHLYMVLNYFPETGVFQWKERTLVLANMLGIDPVSLKMWNTRYADKIAGSINDKGYLVVRIAGHACKLHRAAWMMTHGVWPEHDIDHINGDKSDNRIKNLRAVSRAENMKNKPIYRQNSSGITGVGWHRVTGKWAAKIRVNGKDIHLGVFETVELAEQTRKAAEIHYGFHKNHGRSS
jgi:hypothetical protein